MQIITWMRGLFLKDRGTNEELKKLVGVEPIRTTTTPVKVRMKRHFNIKGKLHNILYTEQSLVYDNG